MNAKRIFIISPTESILTKRGNRHPALAQFLVGRGFDIEYVTSHFYHAEKRWFSKSEINKGKEDAPYTLTVMRCLGYMSNISIRRIVSNFFLSLRFFVYLLPRVNKCTITILPSRPVELITVAALLRLFKGTSVILDIRDIWPDMLPVRNKLKKLLFTLYCNIFLYPSLPIIDKFMHVAPSFVGWLHRYAPKAESLFVPLGFDAARWREEADSKKSVGDNKIRLVCVTILTRVFDVMPVLQAINISDRYHLTLIGDEGEGERYGEVMRYINTNRMSNVSVLGRVRRELMGKHLAEADIGVVPMIASSIPNKVFDYIGCFLPIFVLGENDSADLVNKLEIGWSCPYNASGVRKRLHTINREDVARKRENLAKVREGFDRRNLFQIVSRMLESDSIMHVSPDTIPFDSETLSGSIDRPNGTTHLKTNIR